MAEFEIDIATPDGDMTTFFAHPDGDGPHPIVVMHMDAPGIREELRNFARRIAGEGYFVALPDLYHRLGNIRFYLPNRNDHMTKMIFAAWKSLTNADVVSDTGPVLDYADGHAAADGGAGVIGWCMSGSFTLATAVAFGPRVGAAATLYGVDMVTEEADSPHLGANKIAAELYCAYAEVDQWVPDNVIPDLRTALEAHGVAHEIETFPGTEHGFQFPERTGLYNEAAAEAAWTKIFALFDRALG